jgi:glycosyltransferase involved in cell wall biosynthesis
MSSAPRFAVNAGPLRNPITGVGRYIRELMREIERDGRFTPEYFCALRWARKLDELPTAIPGADSPGMSRLIRTLRPLVRNVARRNFAAGVRRGNFAFYFEPAFVPYATELPTVITIHDLSHLRHPETHPVDRVRDLERDLPRAIERADRILAVSEFTRREVIDIFGVAPERIVTTPLGVDHRFFPRSATETSAFLATLDVAHGRYFLAVGTLEPRKNVLAAIEAHSRLPAAIRQAYPLVVAGMKGWLTHAIDRRLEHARARGDVRLVGYVSDAHLPLLYAGAALLSYPSIYEGFGLPVVEAMASGVPVAVANRASLPEVVGDAGIVLEPHDVDMLSSVMRRIAEDTDFATDRALRGLARAQQFTWRRCARLTMQAFESVLTSA